MVQSAYLKRHTSPHHSMNYWLEDVNDGAIASACLLDISKYFDSNNHKILFKKLEIHGTTSTKLQLLRIHLRGHKQVGQFHLETPEFCDITCGVPQGSDLAQVCFCHL